MTAEEEAASSEENGETCVFQMILSVLWLQCSETMNYPSNFL